VVQFVHGCGCNLAAECGLTACDDAPELLNADGTLLLSTPCFFMAALKISVILGAFLHLVLSFSVCSWEMVNVTQAGLEQGIWVVVGLGILTLILVLCSDGGSRCVGVTMHCGIVVVAAECICSSVYTRLVRGA
jgi:hypothetical protein